MLHRMYFTYANQYIHFNSKLGSNLNQLADLSHEGLHGNHYVDISFRLINLLSPTLSCLATVGVFYYLPTWGWSGSPQQRVVAVQLPKLCKLVAKWHNCLRHVSTTPRVSYYCSPDLSKVSQIRNMQPLTIL